MGGAQWHGNTLYIGSDPAAPQIGDVRVSFEVVEPTHVSLVAQQTAGTFQPYAAQTGGTVALLQTGVHRVEAMFQNAQTDNVILTWILRVSGFLCMLFGLHLIFKPLVVVADVVPFVGNLVAIGTGILAFIPAAVLAVITIAMAWVAYRPLLGGTLFAVALGLLVVIVVKMRQAQTPPEDVSAPAVGGPAPAAMAPEISDRGLNA